MSCFKKVLVFAAVAVVAQLVPGQVHAANPFEKLIGGAAKKVVDGVGSSVQRNVIDTSKVLLKETPGAMLRSLRPQWGSNGSSAPSLQNVNPQVIGQVLSVPRQTYNTGNQVIRSTPRTNWGTLNSSTPTNQSYQTISNQGVYRTFQTTRSRGGLRW